MSESRNKRILKAVVFQFTEDNIYNLALLDYLPDTNLWDDSADSNNGDIVKIMATVSVCIIEFLNSNPTCSVLITGNTASRTRLYNRIAKNYAHEFEAELEIMVDSVDGLVPITFENEHEIFYICKKIIL